MSQRLSMHDQEMVGLRDPSAATEQTCSDDLTWHVLRELELRCGDAVFVLDLNRFTRNYLDFAGAFQAIYANTAIAYSYKTNYLPALCTCARQLGAYAEVVSGMEYELAVRLGVPASRIIFNGPCKTPDDLERALLDGATVNVDSCEESRVIETLAQRFPQATMNVGIRCNFDIGTGARSRFGVNVDEGELATVLETLARATNCEVRGLHCHFSTSERTLSSYARRASRLLELASHFPPGRLRFLNVGGGFFSRVPRDLRAQLTCTVPTFEDYAETIARQFATAFAASRGPELILEPGAALTADVMHFVARVVAIKQTASRTVAVTTGSIHNIKPTLHRLNLPMRVVRDPSKAPPPSNGPIDIVGYTCMEHDCLYGAYAGPIATNDYVLFDNVGAYTIVMKPPFIRSAPAVVCYDADTKRYDIVRRRETFQDVFATYVFGASPDQHGTIAPS